MVESLLANNEDKLVECLKELECFWKTVAVISFFFLYVAKNEADLALLSEIAGMFRKVTDNKKKQHLHNWQTTNLCSIFPDQQSDLHLMTLQLFMFSNEQ